jgi:hypothetical protein
MNPHQQVIERQPFLERDYDLAIEDKPGGLEL